MTINGSSNRRKKLNPRIRQNNFIPKLPTRSQKPPQSKSCVFFQEALANSCREYCILTRRIALQGFGTSNLPIAEFLEPGDLIFFEDLSIGFLEKVISVTLYQESALRGDRKLQLRHLSSGRTRYCTLPDTELFVRPKISFRWSSAHIGVSPEAVVFDDDSEGKLMYIFLDRNLGNWAYCAKNAKCLQEILITSFPSNARTTNGIPYLNSNSLQHVCVGIKFDVQLIFIHLLRKAFRTNDSNVFSIILEYIEYDSIPDTLYSFDIPEEYFACHMAHNYERDAGSFIRKLLEVRRENS